MGHMALSKPADRRETRAFERVRADPLADHLLGADHRRYGP